MAHDVNAGAPSVALVTYGCAKNEADSQEMAARLVRAGYALAPGPDAADVIILNTCSFIQAATEESLDAFFDLAGLPRVRAGASRIVVAGCMPSRYGAELEAELDEAAAFVPCAREDDIVQVVAGLLGGVPPRPAPLAPDGTIGPNEYALTMAGESPWCAYVKISDGCDRHCSYCTIPSIRGRYHSYPLEDIAADVARKVAGGVREVTLIAQDTGRWGRDFPQKSSLAALLDELAQRFSHTWFRVMYIQPEGVTDELLDVMARRQNVCSYLDIPFQHASTGLLRAMNRAGSADEFLALLDRARRKVPGVTLRTTLIAGFPGETDAQFDELLDFVERAELDYVGVFAYSREDGTVAAGLSGQLDEDVKAERAQAVRDVADAVSAGVVAGRVGRCLPVLVLGREEDGQLYGRAQCQAPEVDGVTYLDGGEPGQVVDVEVTGTLLYEMEGERRG